jgi:RimJ/RimL family protein N-acetyltransferase
MTAAAFKLLSWAVSDLQISRFYLEVFKDNQKAINLYERLGFRTVAEFPLRLRVSNGITQWEKFAYTPTDDRAADNFALRMEVTAEQLETAKLQLP